MDNQKPVLDQQTAITLMIIGGIVVILSLAVVFSYMSAKNHPGTVVLPGGITYLGEPQTPTPTSPNLPISQSPNQSLQRFTVDTQTVWATVSGKIYSFQFLSPKTLGLTTFEKDPSDAIAITWGPGRPEEKILVSVIDLSKIDAIKPYIKKPREELINNWWRQYSGLTGVSTLSAFTTTANIRGWRATFLTKDGPSPSEDVFFNVPNKSNLIVRFGSGILSQDVFNRIVKSFSWKK